MNHWETLPSSHAYHAKDEINNGPMMTPEEARWLMDVQKLIRKGNNNCQQLDIYAYPNSQLTEVAQACGLKAKRFTLEDGDLRTSEGRTNLLLTVLLHQPKHVWLSPECGPWSPWNRFNASRSMQCFHKVKQEQNDAKVHIVVQSDQQDSGVNWPTCSHGKSMVCRDLETSTAVRHVAMDDWGPVRPMHVWSPTSKH